MKGQNYLIPFICAQKHNLLCGPHREKCLISVPDVTVFSGGGEKKSIISPFFNNKIPTSHGCAHFAYCSPRHVESPSAKQN